MCTVTIVRCRPGDEANPSYRLLCNRDELRTRPPADPPIITSVGPRKAIHPVDPVAGGTWIAVNDAGLTLTILNRNPRHASSPKAADGFTSRGRIIPTLLDCATIADLHDALPRLDAFRFTPYRFVATDGHEVLEVVDEAAGRGRSVQRSPLDEPMLFTSSGLGDHLVEPPRRALFEQWFAPVPTDDPQQHLLKTQHLFHHHFWLDRRHLSVCMSRPDAMTVSLTRVDVSPTRVSLRYHGSPPIEPVDEVEQHLVRTSSGETGA